MDKLTLAGFVVAIIGILGGQALEGGHIGSIIQPTAAMIVFGGTIGAVLVAFPMRTVKDAMAAAKLAFFEPHVDEEGMVEQILEWARRARKEGLLALDEASQTAPDPFVRKALRLAVDGVDPKAARTTLESQLSQEEDRGHQAAKVFESAGAFCPTVGILGAVLGLIHVMENLSDPSSLGGGIAVAFVATVYGVGAANLVLLPMAQKIKLQHGREVLAHELAMEGVLAIQAGENPRVIEERLNAYLAEKREEAKSSGA